MKMKSLLAIILLAMGVTACSTVKKVVYRIHMKRVINRKLVMGLADGEVEVDGRVIYTAIDLKVGLFQDTSSF